MAVHSRPMLTSRKRQATYRANWQTHVRRVSIFTFLLITAALMVAPFVWMLLTAIKPDNEVFSLNWLPSRPQWSNFQAAWAAAPFGRFYLNSVFVATAATAAEVLVGLLSAYAFARIRVPGRNVIFFFVLATLMIPVDVTIIPNYVTLSRIGWIDTYWALIIPPASNAFGTFLLRQHIFSLPEELFDAAKIDGANHWHMLTRIVLPLSLPILATLGLLGFIGKWNSYLWPLLVTNRENMRTLPIGLKYLVDQEGFANVNLIMAATTFVVFPVIILFLLTQRQFITGITRGAVRGGG